MNHHQIAKIMISVMISVICSPSFAQSPIISQAIIQSNDLFGKPPIKNPQKFDFSLSATRQMQMLAAVKPRLNDLWPKISSHSLNVYEWNGQQTLWANNQHVRAVHLAPNLTPPPGAMFSFVDQGNAPGIVMNWQNIQQFRTKSYPEDFDIRTSFHEWFHHFAQNNWRKASLQNGSRADFYPLRADPRIARQALINALLASLLAQHRSAQSQQMAYAAYWYQTWKHDYPYEYQAIRSYDILEGTARYMELRAWFLWLKHAPIAQAQYPKVAALPEDQLMKNALARFYATPRIMPEMAVQAYDVGSLACLLLDREKYIQWKQKVANGISPLDLLLDDRQATRQRADPLISQRINTLLRPKKKIAQHWFARLDQVKNDPDMVRIGLREQNAQGSLQDAMLFMTNTHYQEMIAGLSGSFKTPTSSFKIQQTSVFTSERCGGYTYEVLIPKKAIRKSQNRLWIAKKISNISGHGQVKKTESGLQTLYCF